LIGSRARGGFFISLVLGEDAPQIRHAGFGTAVGLFAWTPLQFLFAHGHAGGIGADIQDGHRRTAGLGWALLPRLGRSTHPLHHSLNLSRGHVNAAGFGQVLLRFLIAHFIGPLQTQQPRQSRRVGHFQTQRGIGWVVSLFLARMVVIVALQFKGAKHALQLQRFPPFPLLSRLGLVGGVQAVGSLLQEESHQRVGGLENSSAHQHFQLLNCGPGRLLGGESGHQLRNFLFLCEEEVALFFFAQWPTGTGGCGPPLSPPIVRQALQSVGDWQWRLVSLELPRRRRADSHCGRLARPDVYSRDRLGRPARRQSWPCIQP
jgi:hypothetical protein